jgi:DNA-directed RNA polymerase subunit F
MLTTEINSERCRANPIFIEEVYLYLKNRFKNLNDKINVNKYENSIEKIIDYCVKFCCFKKPKIKELRGYININIKKESLKDEDRVQAEIILCKIIDLNPDTFKTLVLLLPSYNKYFTQNKFRKHYKNIRSLINK